MSTTTASAAGSVVMSSTPVPRAPEDLTASSHLMNWVQQACHANYNKFTFTAVSPNGFGATAGTTAKANHLGFLSWFAMAVEAARYLDQVEDENWKRTLTAANESQPGKDMDYSEVRAAAMASIKYGWAKTYEVRESTGTSNSHVDNSIRSAINRVRASQQQVTAGAAQTLKSVGRFLTEPRRFPSIVSLPDIGSDSWALLTSRQTRGVRGRVREADGDDDAEEAETQRGTSTGAELTY